MPGQPNQVNLPGYRRANTAGLVTTFTTLNTPILVDQVHGPSGSGNSLAGRTAVIFAIWATNQSGSNLWLKLGHTVDGTVATAFTQDLPSILLLNGFDRQLTEEEIPDHKFDYVGNILAEVDTTVLTGQVTLRIEVEETGF